MFLSVILCIGNKVEKSQEIGAKYKFDEKHNKRTNFLQISIRICKCFVLALLGDQGITTGTLDNRKIRFRIFENIGEYHLD